MLALTRLLVLLVWAWPPAWAFELFAEQQLFPLQVANQAGGANETSVGSTHIDDYWVKLDGETGIPSPGILLSRHVRLGCFEVRWDTVDSSAYVRPDDVGWSAGSAADPRAACVASCNDTQVYFRLPECRCAIAGHEPPLEEVLGLCPSSAWEIFREYDYRSSMSPSAYDAARRLIYQIVTVRMPQSEQGIRHYVHAIDAVDASPRFEFDACLERMLFSTVWDFGRSRMIGLSFQEFGSTLDLSVVAFNMSTGTLVVQQEHTSIHNQLVESGALLSAGVASADGLGAVDVLFGTYYTVLPAQLPGSTQVVHMVVAIDLETRQVLESVTLPITLMNLQINALQHVLYGAGADLAGRYAYFELCRAAADDGGRKVSVECRESELGALPPVVNHMYLQSAAIDHELNYAWFMYKQATAGNPQILEYHHDAADYYLWPENTLHSDVAFVSLIQPAAGSQTVYSLPAPRLLQVRFSSRGDRLILKFDSPTLQGNVPLDSDGDGVPDAWEVVPTGERLPCERFLDARTVNLLVSSSCYWTAPTELLAEVTPRSQLAPGDIVALRPGAVFAADRSPSGVAVFSAASEGTAVTEPPQDILGPRAVISVPGASRKGVLSSCWDLVLDGSSSSGHGLRGAFVWLLMDTEPPISAEKLTRLEHALAVAATDAVESGGGWAQVLTIPSAALVANTTYHFSLSVTSFFDPAVWDTATASVHITDEADSGFMPSLSARQGTSEAPSVAEAGVRAGRHGKFGGLGSSAAVLGSAAAAQNASSEVQALHFGPAPPPAPPWGNHHIVFASAGEAALMAPLRELRHL